MQVQFTINIVKIRNLTQQKETITYKKTSHYRHYTINANSESRLKFRSQNYIPITLLKKSTHIQRVRNCSITNQKLRKKHTDHPTITLNEHLFTISQSQLTEM